MGVCRWLTSHTAFRLQLRGQRWNKEDQEVKAGPEPVKRLKMSQNEPIRRLAACGTSQSEQRGPPTRQRQMAEDR